MQTNNEQLIQIYSGYLAQANYDKAVLQATIDSFKTEIEDLKYKYDNLKCFLEDNNIELEGGLKEIEEGYNE